MIYIGIINDKLFYICIFMSKAFDRINLDIIQYIGKFANIRNMIMLCITCNSLYKDTRLFICNINNRIKCINCNRNICSIINYEQSIPVLNNTLNEISNNSYCITCWTTRFWSRLTFLGWIGIDIFDIIYSHYWSKYISINYDCGICNKQIYKQDYIKRIKQFPDEYKQKIFTFHIECYVKKFISRQKITKLTLDSINLIK